MQPVSPVVRGLEHYELVFGNNNPDHLKVPVLVVPNDRQGQVIIRMQLDDDERHLLEMGGDLYLTFLTGSSGSFPPFLLQVMTPWDYKPNLENEQDGPADCNNCNAGANQTSSPDDRQAMGRADAGNEDAERD